MIISTILTEKPRIEGNSVTLPIVRVGTKAKGNDGKIYTIGAEAINSSAESYTNGNITRNHKDVQQGYVSRSWLENDFIMAQVDGLSSSMVDRINSDEYRGVSQEAIEATFNDAGEVISLKGTGVSFIFSDHPETPGCPLEMGCGVPIASTLVENSINGEETHKFDIAVINNAGNLIKVRETTVWLPTEEAEKEEVLTRRLLEDSVYGVGPGIFRFYDYNPEIKIGDQMPANAEPAHTLNILLSTIESFNFPLNTHNQNSLSNTPGGVHIADDVTKLESTISEQVKEITDLKSTIETLRQELTEKDSKIESTISAAVKAALEAHDTQLKEASEMNATLEILSTVMSEETREEFLKSEPSIAVIKSTIAAIKSTTSKQIGASGGKGGSGGKIESTYNAGSDIYSKLGVSAEDLEKYGGI